MPSLRCGPSHTRTVTGAQYRASTRDGIPPAREGPARRPEAAHVRQRPTPRTVTGGKRQQQCQRGAAAASAGRPPLCDTALAVLAALLIPVRLPPSPSRLCSSGLASAPGRPRRCTTSPGGQAWRQPQDSVLGACCCPGRCTRRHADGKGNTVGSRIRRAHAAWALALLTPEDTEVIGESWLGHLAAEARRRGRKQRDHGG